MEDGMFLACESTVRHEVQARSSLSAAPGNEGLFNLRFAGNGVAYWKAMFPFGNRRNRPSRRRFKIDGSFAIGWSGSPALRLNVPEKPCLVLPHPARESGKCLYGTGKVYGSSINAFSITG